SPSPRGLPGRRSGATVFRPWGGPPRRAVDRARSGEGPTLIEAMTYRMKGHAEHDAQAYVPKEDLDEWRRRDPLERYARVLVEAGDATAEELAAIDRAVTE